MRYATRLSVEDHPYRHGVASTTGLAIAKHSPVMGLGNASYTVVCVYKTEGLRRWRVPSLTGPLQLRPLENLCHTSGNMSLEDE